MTKITNISTGDHRHIFDVLEYGPVVFGDYENGVLITINNHYLNWWSQVSDTEWKCADCRSYDYRLSQLSWGAAKDLAKDWYDEVMDFTDDEEDNSPRNELEDKERNGEV